MNFDPPGWLILLLLPLVFVGLGVVPGFIAALLERRRVRNYEPVAEDEAAPISEYARWVEHAAGRLGYDRLGVFRDAKGKIYNVRYDFWASPGRDVIAYCGVGTMLGIPVKATWLFTPLSDGRCLMTTDHSAAMESDLSGMTEMALVANADFDELLARHRKRVDEAPLPSGAFSKADPFGGFNAFRRSRVERLIERGQARFLDDEQDAWKYTVRGALAVATNTYREQFAAIVGNTFRSSVPRPGDPGYGPSPRKRRKPWLTSLMKQARFVGVIAVGIALLQNAREGPARNEAQSRFRAAWLAGGAGLVVVSTVLLSLDGRKHPPEDDPIEP